MKITVKYNGRKGEQTDSTVQGILDNHGAERVSAEVGASGEAPGDHVLNCIVGDARAAECCAQLDQYNIEWHETVEKDTDEAVGGDAS